MHAILGAGGAVSPELAKLLTEEQIPVRSVSRSGKTAGHGTALAADITTPEGALAAVKGCEVAYLTVGLPYKLSAWQKQWVPMVKNVIDACAETGTTIIFVDNIYMLSDNSVPNMKEDSPMWPSSRKGMVRAEVDKLFLDAFAESKVQGIIARAADFYGYMDPNKSLLLDLVIKRMVQGKSPQWMYTTEKKHAFTYIPDIARALVAMSKRPDAYNRIWHLPTSPAMTLDEFISIINRQLGTNRKPQVMSETLLKLVRLLVPPLMEMKELKYQMVQDYHLNSRAFEDHFKIKPTPYETGLAEVIKALR